MTTAVHQKPATAPAPSAKLLFEGLVPIESIKVVSNIRKAFNEAALKELAENIKSLGIISPLTVRPGVGKDQYILVAGERRLRSAKAAGLKEVPVRVLELNEQRALEYQAAENIHRKDLTPIEEARAYKALFDARRYTVGQLAQLVDKSEGHVYRAIRLLELPEDLLGQIDEGKIVPALGHQLLRLPKEQRTRSWKGYLSSVRGWSNEIPTVKGLQQWIDRDQKDLTRAAWDKKQPYAGMPACSTCPYNTANQTNLFESGETATGKCTSAPCYEKKRDQVIAEEIAELKKKYGTQFLDAGDRNVYESGTIDGYTVIGRWSDKKHKGQAQFKIVFDNTQEPYAATKVKTEAKKELGYVPQKMSKPEVERRSPKEAFIDRWIELELFKEVSKSAKLDKMLTRIAEELTGTYWSQGITARFEALELDPELITEKVEKAKTTEEKVRLLYQVVLCKNTPYGGSDDEAKQVGIDAKAFEKSNAAAAEKAWNERRTKKA